MSFRKAFATRPSTGALLGVWSTGVSVQVKAVCLDTAPSPLPPTSRSYFPPLFPPLSPPSDTESPRVDRHHSPKLSRLPFLVRVICRNMFANTDGVTNVSIGQISTSPGYV